MDFVRFLRHSSKTIFVTRPSNMHISVSRTNEVLLSDRGQNTLSDCNLAPNSRQGAAYIPLKLILASSRDHSGFTNQGASDWSKACCVENFEVLFGIMYSLCPLRSPAPQIRRITNQNPTHSNALEHGPPKNT